MPRGRKFLDEARRRDVLRPMMLYIGAVWAFGQGLSQFSPVLNLPDWVTRWFLIAAVIGFPFWIALAWFYELTPQGFRREEDVAPDAPARRANARRLDVAIIAVLAIAVALLGAGYFVRTRSSTTQRADDFAPPSGSLVVLPFKNLGGDPKQQYFSDGITQELTGTLGRNPALRVIAWDTASRYHDSQLGAKLIGKALNVAHVLSGSIERLGSEVRISVELTNSVTGYQVWSHHFDNSFADNFAVQDQMSQSIADALEVRFSQADLPRGGTRNPQAHELVLKSLTLLASMDAASFAAARANLEQAIQLDQDYADAHAMLAQVLLGLSQHGNLPLAEALPKVQAEANRALALDPNNANALMALGLAYDNASPREVDKAREQFVKVIAIDPSNNAARTDYALDLPLKPARAEVEKVAELDPVNLGNWNNLAVYDQDLSDWPGMIRAAKKILQLRPSFVFGAFYLAFAYQQTHDYDKMVQAFDRAKPSDATAKQLLDTGRIVYQAVREPSRKASALTALEKLWKAQSGNQDVTYNVAQMYLALGETAPALRILKDYCHSVPVACSDLGINPVYESLRKDPDFQQLATRYTTMALE